MIIGDNQDFVIEPAPDRQVWVRHRPSRHLFKFAVSEGDTAIHGEPDIEANPESDVDSRPLIANARATADRLHFGTLPLRAATAEPPSRAETEAAAGTTPDQPPPRPPQQPPPRVGADDATIQAVQQTDAARRRSTAALTDHSAGQLGPQSPAPEPGPETETPRIVQLEARATAMSSGRASISVNPNPQAGTAPTSTESESSVASTKNGQGSLTADATLLPAADRDPEIAAAILARIPKSQSPAPIRVEERDGKIALVRNREDRLLASEEDFKSWSEPVLRHIRELLSGDFRQGTNHSRVRDRLIAINDLLSGSVADIKDRQFLIGYEVERFGGLISAYRSSADDMPALNAAVLNDLDQLHRGLSVWVDKLGRWSEFHRQGLQDPDHEGEANPAVVANTVEAIASKMEIESKYFDPELPRTFRVIGESLKDPWGATKTAVYGAVKSVENVIAFLARTVLDTARNTVTRIGDGISKATAKVLLLGLSAGALALSATLPQPWAWLAPLLKALAGTLGH